MIDHARLPAFAPPRIGDRVVYDRPPARDGEPLVWQDRREHPSLVLHDDAGIVSCLLLLRDEDGRLRDGVRQWGAKAEHLRVVARAHYADVDLTTAECNEALRGSTVALDFDGPIHSYTSGWTGYLPGDPPTPGAVAFVDLLVQAGARVVVHTTRADTPEGAAAVRAYLARHGFPDLPVTHEKIPAAAYVDDRGVHFDPRVGYDETVVARVVKLCLTRHHGEAHPDERTGEAAALDEAFLGTRDGADLRGLGEARTEEPADVPDDAVTVPPGWTPGSTEPIEFAGPCPFLSCLLRGRHKHPVCGDCGAVRYGNASCATCAVRRPFAIAAEAKAYAEQEAVDGAH